jgi:hypothetical protein
VFHADILSSEVSGFRGEVQTEPSHVLEWPVLEGSLAALATAEPQPPQREIAAFQQLTVIPNALTVFG